MTIFVSTISDKATVNKITHQHNEATENQHQSTKFRVNMYNPPKNHYHHPGEKLYNFESVGTTPAGPRTFSQITVVRRATKEVELNHFELFPCEN